MFTRKHLVYQCFFLIILKILFKSWNKKSVQKVFYISLVDVLKFKHRWYFEFVGSAELAVVLGEITHTHTHREGEK